LPERAARNAQRPGLISGERAAHDVAGRVGNGYRLCCDSNCVWLACSEGDDAADRIVRRNADGYAIAWHHLDAESPHAPAQLGEHFVASVTLNPVEPAAVNRHDSALHVD
jgi:hypothetical protein